MAKKVKLAILRARHSPGIGEMPENIPDQACIEMLMRNKNRTAVLNYWSDNTAGYLDFSESTMFPWVDISMMASDVSRRTQAVLAYEATKKLNNDKDLTGFDGFLILTWPGWIIIPNPEFGQPVKPGDPPQPETITVGFDKGASKNLFGKPFCSLPVMLSDHTFMCHELGHVLGFEHTYGVWNNGVDWDGQSPWDVGQVYGDPYDIMSSASFGSRNSTPNQSGYRSSPSYAGASVKDWPIQPEIVMGPAPALAHVHHWDAAVLPPDKIHELDMSNGGEQKVRIHAAGRKGQEPQLIIVHPGNEDELGRYRCYVEYREDRGWDQGLGISGDDLARRAVVVHALADTLVDVSNYQIRCWYRGQILVPVEIDSDLEVYNSPFTVRVIGENVEAGHVDVEIATTNPRGVDVRVTRKDEELETINPQKAVTPCGDTITSATWRMRSTHSYLPASYGYGGQGEPDASRPIITWSVGPIAVPSGAGTLVVPVSTGLVRIGYSLDPVTGELTLNSRVGEKYMTTVTATASEADGSNPVSQTFRFDPPGEFTGFRPGDLGILNNCMGTFLKRVKVRPEDLLIPPGPDPFQETWRDQVNQGRVEKVIQAVDPSYPAEAAALKTIAAMRFGKLQ